MKITHRDFYLEVARKQDELCKLSGPAFWPEIKRLFSCTNGDGDVREMFNETFSSLGNIDNAIKDPYEQEYNDGWKDYAKLAAMQHVFNLNTGDVNEREGNLSYNPYLDVDGMATQDERDSWLALDSSKELMEWESEWSDLDDDD